MFARAARLIAGVALFASLAAQATVLVDFQVAQPPPLPQDAKQCTVQILQYVIYDLERFPGDRCSDVALPRRTFGFSFGLYVTPL